MSVHATDRQFERVDTDAICRDNPIADIIGATLSLKRMGRELVACCPFHSEKSPSFTVSPDKGFYHCFGCGAHGDVIRWVQDSRGVDFLEAVRQLGAGELERVDLPKLPEPGWGADRSDAALAVAARSLPIESTVGEEYLRFRVPGIAPPYPADLRFAHLTCDNLGPLPCVIAVMRDVGGLVTAVQRIWVANDGQGKADVSKPKRSLGRVKGSALRLGDLGDANTLTVCEGPETGLALFEMLGAPVWVSAGGVFLPHLVFPPQVRSVVIGADNDAAGEAKAAEAAANYAERGLTVRTIRPASRFSDFADEYKEAR